MSTPSTFARRLAATGAVATLSLTTVLATNAFGAPADEPLTVDGVVDVLLGQNGNARAFNAGGHDNLWLEGVTSVSTDASGAITVTHSAEADVAAIEARLEGLAVSYGTREIAQPLAENEVVGGAGFAADAGDGFYSLCSVGFPAFDGSRDNLAIITAGHCTGDDTVGDVLRTVPSADDAAFFPEESPQPALWDDLGVYVASQFGGPGHAPNVDGTDGALMEVQNGDLSLLPFVSDWTTFENDDLAASGSDVTAVGHAQIGDETCRSGRTTGHHCGEILEEGVYAVAGHDYPDNPDDVRLVRGFQTSAIAAQGDSGGSFVTGTTAIGVLSAGGEDENGEYTIAAHLDEVLETVAPNAEIILFIEVPTVSTTGEVQVGSAISGTGVAGDTIVVTPTSGAPFEVTVGGDGTWSFPAPDAEGEYTFTVQAVRSLNQSAVSGDNTVTIVPADAEPIAAPAITSPADGSTVNEDVATISGTGLAGATVTLGGDAAGEAVVDASGAWSVTLETPLSYGAYTVTASQATAEQTSPEASAAFTVAPVAPTITAPTAGEYAQDALPTAVTGTGIEGAEVTVLLNGQPLEAADEAADLAGTLAAVTDGAFSVALPTLAPGEHTITATQTVNGVTSVPTEVVITVLAADDPGPDGELPETGSNGTGLLIGIAAALVVAGGLTVVVRRRISHTS